MYEGLLYSYQGFKNNHVNIINININGLWDLMHFNHLMQIEMKLKGW